MSVAFCLSVVVLFYPPGFVLSQVLSPIFSYVSDGCFPPQSFPPPFCYPPTGLRQGPMADCCGIFCNQRISALDTGTNCLYELWRIQEKPQTFARAQKDIFMTMKSLSFLTNLLRI